MDKLQAVLKYKFWLLFLAAFGLATAGYFMTVGGVQTAFEERRELITSTENSIPATQGKPNETFETGLKQRVEELQDVNLIVMREMWIEQLSSMSWPGVIAKFLPLGYRAELKSPAYYEQYARIYDKQIEDTWRLLEPVLTSAEDEIGHEDDPQKIIVDMAQVHRDPTIRPNQTTPIANETMWDAQEDIWYQRSLFKALARANAESTSVNDASIREISYFTLLGGDGKPTLAGASPTATASAGTYDGGFGGGSRQGAGGTRSQVDIKFDPAEEFGASGLATRGLGNASFSIDYTNPSASASVRPDVKRYINYTEGNQFRERGFYISMLVRQADIPDILTSISNSDWPTRIVRFHVGPNPYFKDEVKLAPATNRRGGGGEFDYGPEAYGGSEEEDYTEDFMVEDYMNGGGGGFGARTASTKVTDKTLLSALESSSLLTLDVAGAITMYNPPPEEVLAVARQPVPVNGQDYEILPETVTDTAVAEQLTAERAAADEAVEEEEARELEAAKADAGLPTEPTDGETTPIDPAATEGRDDVVNEAGTPET